MLTIKEYYSEFLPQALEDFFSEIKTKHLRFYFFMAASWYTFFLPLGMIFMWFMCILDGVWSFIFFHMPVLILINLLGVCFFFITIPYYYFTLHRKYKTYLIKKFIQL